jgi:hypothetical protein
VVQIGASRANGTLVRIIAYAALSSAWHPLAAGEMPDRGHACGHLELINNPPENSESA